MTYPSNTPPRPFHGWEAARRLGRELADHPGRRGVVDKLRELDERYFAVASLDETEREAVHVLLTGIAASVDTAFAVEGIDDEL
jgi:hypothetical protein